MKPQKAPRGPSERNTNLWEKMYPQRCLLCGKPIGPEGCFCWECREVVPESVRVRVLDLPGLEGKFLVCAAPLPYEGEVKKLLYDFKFGKRENLAPILAEAMESTIRVFEEEPDVFSYVPMDPRVRENRLYNQSQVLAEELSLHLGIPVMGLLDVNPQWLNQHRLSGSERQEDPQVSYYRASASAEGKRVLLVDDVMTTGETLMSCAEALYRMGALQVWGLCVADAGYGMKDAQ